MGHQPSFLTQEPSRIDHRVSVPGARGARGRHRVEGQGSSGCATSLGFAWSGSKMSAVVDRLASWAVPMRG